MREVAPDGDAAATTVFRPAANTAANSGIAGYRVVLDCDPYKLKGGHTEMNQPNPLSDDAIAHSAPDELPVDRPRVSGFVLRKIDVPAALDVLDSFLEEDEAEQWETFEYLKRSLDETRASHGARPLFPGHAASRCTLGASTEYGQANRQRSRAGCGYDSRRTGHAADR